ncbi:MAG: hypothetical protein K2Y71_26165 [Xanthobacteraceae bacterium]|nr:hypothetical protein [Xanthobacteraceae bacterium]
MVKFSTPPGLEGLFDLDRKGVDIRPTLLRVLTDQYLRSPVHTPDEERKYTELAMRLIDETDIATRAAVSVRLAPHACAPRTIMLQLARDVLEVAEPVLLQSPVLTPEDCRAIIAERGVSYADIIARRPKAAPAPPPAPVPLPAPAPVPGPVKAAAPVIVQSPEPEPVVAAAPVAEAVPIAPAAPADPPPAATTENIAAGENTAPDDDAQSEAQAADEASARELCELFFAAGSAERRLILLNLDYAEWPVGQPPEPLQRADVWRLETAALRHHTGTLMRELERALGISYQQSRRIVEDETGEPIVAAAKAMSIPADILQRIVLFMNPRIGQSVDRVYELSALYREISVEAARRLVTILRAAEPAGAGGSDTRAIQGTAETARRALSETSASTGSTTTRKPELVPRRAASGEN